jgi:uncharacterized protein (TIGR02271 family)
MSQSDTKIVTDRNGQRGIIESMPDPQIGGNTPVTVRLDNGQKLLVPLEVLAQMNDGSYHLPFTLSEFLTSSTATSLAAAPLPDTAQTFMASENAPPLVDVNGVPEHQARAGTNNLESIVVPVAEEALSVGKRVIETGGVRINKTVHERQETVDIALTEDHVEVERVPINRVVEGPVEVRREGETLIIPLYEEVFVVEKRLMLKEELHIRMRREEVHKPQQVTLRREEVSIERFSRGTDAVEAEQQSSQPQVQKPV